MLHVSIVDSFCRIYPRTLIDHKQQLVLYAALNERQAFQVVVRNESPVEPIKVSLSLIVPKELKARIRRIGYVPVPHLNTPVMDIADCEGLCHVPGYIPDPLFDENSTKIPPCQTQAFWLDVTPSKFAKPGKYQVEISVLHESSGLIRKVKAIVNLANIRLQPRKDFRVSHWFYTDALIDWYKTDGYDEKFWRLLPSYLKNLARHGQDTVLVPIFTPPLDGVKTPSQLLKVERLSDGKYLFDFSDIKKFITISKRVGLKYFEWPHLATQWGAKNAIHVYERQGEKRKLLWSPKTSATSKIYKNFLRQFLPEWHVFLKKNHLLKNSFFHLSDEPHGKEHLKNYRAFRQILTDIAPWMKIMDALSDTDFAQIGLTDIPIASESVVADFIKKDIVCWVYYCCIPRGKFLNHLLDTPLAKIAMHGLLFYRWNLSGFLNWGYNFWYRFNTTKLIDPFMVSDAYNWPNWPHGDTFLVYPGENGPIDSIRWEVFSLAMQDYQLLQTLGISRKSKHLVSIKSFEDFPKDINWRLKLRKKLLNKR